jgi:hypothetical protein
MEAVMDDAGDDRGRAIEAQDASLRCMHDDV